MKKEKGITLISLIITIVLLLIITGTTVYTSVNRFKINNLQKMYNDIELLDGKVNNYYLKYGGLPIVRDADNNPVNYTKTTLDFNKDANDNENYYIIDLSAIGDITLNYGEEGYESPNASDDVYIINEKTHNIYYVRGIEYTDGKTYHSKKVNGNVNEDMVPPTQPEINVVDGDRIVENNYETNVTLEFVSGKDNYSGINKTTYSINGSEEKDINNLENKKYQIKDKGKYNIILRTYDNSNNMSEISKNIFIGIEYLESTGTQCIDTGYKPTQYAKVEVELSFDGEYNPNRNTTTFLKAIDKENNNVFGVNFGATGEYKNNALFPWVDKIYGSGGVIYETEIIDDIRQNRNTLILESENFEYGSINKKIATRTNDSNVSLVLFGNHSQNELISFDAYNMKLYNCKIYDNNQLIRYFIPVIDENGVACLYDKVEGKFYYNAGTGEFKTNLDE